MGFSFVFIINRHTLPVMTWFGGVVCGGGAIGC